MGEAKRKSRHRSQILASEQRCVYCDALPTTVEHMPPKAIFPKKIRLSGMEYACCEGCNYFSRASDCAAGFLSRLSPTNVIDALELEEAQKLLVTLTKIAPDFVRELFDERKISTVWERGRDPLIGRKKRLQLDGPITQALMRTFSAKLGMALFREHVGKPLPLSGLVFTSHFFNAGLNREEVEATLSILPVRGELRQGKRASGVNFNYRYNTDQRSIIGAFVAINNNLFVRIFAISDKIFEKALLGSHEFEPIRPGELKTLSERWMPNPRESGQNPVST